MTGHVNESATMLLTVPVLLTLLSGGVLACMTENALDRGEHVSEFRKNLPGALLVSGFALLGLMLSLAIHAAGPLTECCR